MYVLQNAARNVWRNRGRNMLLGAMMLVVIATTVIAMMITSTSSGIIEDYKSRFGSEVTFTPDIESLREEASADASADANGGPMRLEMPTIDADQYLAFGDSEYLKAADYTASTGIVPTDLTVVDEDLGGGSSGMRMGGGPGQEEEQESDDAVSYMAQLMAGSFEEFDDGSRVLADGEMPEELNEVIVSSEIAELNELEIGDTFTATGALTDPDGGEAKEIGYDDLTVVGVYDDLTEEYSRTPVQNAYSNTRNQVLTNVDTVLENYDSAYGGIQVSATYYLTSPDVLDEFEEEVRAEGLPEVFEVTTDESAYETIVAPVEGLKSISTTFMIVVLALGGVIIALLSSTAIRERKYEIGVLRAMGMKKSVVALGLWVESLILTATCLVAGLALGALVAQPVTDTLLAGQVAAAETATEGQGPMGDGMGRGGGMGMGGGGGAGGFGPAGGATDAEPLTELAVGLSPAGVGQIALVAFLLATLAGVVAISRITKYEPIKILAERN
ncbi:ABC transporter permease [Nocardiopsis aegyptia]|uniref:Putative ABC transport system permease protein n=1 Tax=Nocardiopsis aegyptia TaxID=220378 RepID=A0A7Z0JA35_9ACTN|nr:ABC transporter permease [Nocardiopsis aegyptia]NYJ34367.1 putative ABC transport system permease protein [Nocardiopsis aegyptia]